VLLRRRFQFKADRVGDSAERRDHDESGAPRNKVYLGPMRTRSSRRPIVERLPCIRLKDIRELIPRHNPHITVNPDPQGWKYPGQVRLSALGIKITDHGAPQLFKFTRVSIGLGKERLLIVCQCGRNTTRLFYRDGCYSCRHCPPRVDYLIQHLSPGRRKLWKATRLRLKLSSAPNDDALPKRPKGKNRKHYLRAIDEIAQLEQKKYRLRNRTIDSRYFPYHIAR
jgi:hypothetical protein